MSITLLVMSSPGDNPTPTQGLLQEGSLGPAWTVLNGGDCIHLMHQFNAHAPNQVVLLGPVSVVTNTLGAWNGMPPCAVSWVGTQPTHEELTQLLDLGLSGWWPDTGLSAATLATGLALDGLRWQRHAALAQALGQVQGQLSDRKYVDRAKGVLAQARGLDEDEAFKLLRGAAMHTKLKIGDVSRSVIEAAAWAEALNRAGQLRMLSQRLVKLAAQRLAGVDAHRARKLQEDSEQRAQANLDFLSALPQLGAQGEALPEAVARTQAAWSILQNTLAQRKSAAVLKQADDKANALLMQAEALVSELETASGRRALNVVNLCGRQRMLAQRLAKDALLAEMLDDSARREGFAQLKSEFEAALLELELAPLSSPEIRDALKAAREEWTRLLSGLRFLDKSESRLAISRASEVLLEVFEGLTALYERSLQVIMS
ncbi:MAG: ANTAR domain-containing protein [Aquabacterium sp.]|uniref:ANTAR domain-containing protein n=1 Tax=Aquabacterium sp. TaxID=1872578 RepID=UPI002721A6A8|nr:ANTAR domain-containing protein [Aquabacterium sp.]MDO9003241.1 ANTAR domain-containing protein [Aquabacterium sp.]